jgi:hypothetical protein
MSKRDKTKKELQLENEKLCMRPKDAEEALRTTRGGPVDTLIVPGELGDPVFTFEDPKHPYRVLVGTIRDGAAVLTGREAHWSKPGPPIEHQRKEKMKRMV